MLPKHSKDIVFIVIILLLIGMIWGVPKEFWILISVNVIVIMVGILYVKLNGAIENHGINVTESDKVIYEVLNKNTNVNSNTNKDDTYKRLVEIAEEEMDEFLEEANYENFDNVKRGKEIAENFINSEMELAEAIHEIKSICKFKLQAYYLGISLIANVDAEKVEEVDYDHIALGVKIIKGVHLDHDTELLKFLRNTKLKIDD